MVNKEMNNNEKKQASKKELLEETSKEEQNNIVENAETTDKSTEKRVLGEDTEKSETMDDNGSSLKSKDDADKKSNQHKIPFIELFAANFADVTAISALTFILLFLSELIFHLLGYYFKDQISIYLILFIFTSLVYAPICAKTKLGSTIGQKLFYMELKKEN